MCEVEENNLIHDCLKNNRLAQYRLYEKHSHAMFSICRRYAKCQCDAEDIMQEGFIKVFRYLSDYRHTGSFEGWMRRIMVTTAFNFYKRKKFISNESELNHLADAEVSEQQVIARLLHDELMNIVGDLPNGYRNVFRLNSVEGYTHKEIGQMLNISENTSKSQLTRARMSLQKRFCKLNGIETNMLQIA
ncbi:MAG: sigma-70 family RNA polymerase sigma factor [Bacteroidales bacterium]|nr:sigma-70 family RNA polymerase sigma factor [Bacteroidales bacterium]